MSAAAARAATCAILAATLLVPAHAAVKNPVGRPVWLVPDAVTHHTLRLNGRVLAYTARAGTIVLRDDDEHPMATMFYTAYTLDAKTPSRRPVTFLYNGGPGSATIWLRMGSFGPKRVVIAPNAGITRPAPFALVDNRYTLLDASDLVFVDMPASGYSRIWPGYDAKKVFGSDNDVHAFAQFIERYITTFGRWNSPKFLFGESYGTPRSAMLVDYLQNDGISINGVVLQSSLLNYQFAPAYVFGGAATTDWEFIFALPTEAAAAWYHRAAVGAPKSLDAYMTQMRRFAMGEYRQTLLQGNQLAPGDFDAMVNRLHAYLGVSTQYIRNANLRISSARYIAELRRERGQTAGIYDARYLMYSLDNAEETPSLEPTDAAIDGPYRAMSSVYLRNELRYKTTLTYLLSASAAIQKSGPWDFKHNDELPLNTAPDLAEAMTFNPHLRVFSANGYYDSVTPFLATVYTLQHLNLAAPLTAHISYGFYPSGHMIYLNTAALAQFHRDLERWYAATLAAH
jgi:carboxypeptidase C (cathepsin A)